MNIQKKKNSLTREQAAKLYDDLKAAMEKRHGKQNIAKLMQEEAQKRERVVGPRGVGAATLESLVAPSTLRSSQVGSGLGQNMALLLVIMFACIKLGLSVLEASGAFNVEDAQASQVSMARPAYQFAATSREELQLLKSLDARRSELEERSRKLDQVEEDIQRRDREFAARLTELRELTQRLGGEREKTDRRRMAQLDQLAKVYGSMNPQESAQLIEQLDVTIALALVERMPEKRIGQILALMSPDKALLLTRMLSRQ